MAWWWSVDDIRCRGADLRRSPDDEAPQRQLHDLTECPENSNRSDGRTEPPDPARVRFAYGGRAGPGRAQAIAQTGRALEVVTLSWNIVGVVVLAVAAWSARSVALAGFGLDSLMKSGPRRWCCGSSPAPQRTVYRYRSSTARTSVGFGPVARISEADTRRDKANSRGLSSLNKWTLIQGCVLSLNAEDQCPRL